MAAKETVFRDTLISVVSPGFPRDVTDITLSLAAESSAAVL
jgi:hypothetical protein